MRWEALARGQLRFHCPCGAAFLSQAFARHARSARHRAWAHATGAHVRPVAYDGCQVGSRRLCQRHQSGRGCHVPSA